MSEIDKKYQEVIKSHPAIGNPIGNEHVCDDKIGRYREYTGGASIYYTPSTGAHLIYGLIRDKWIKLGREKGPNGYPTTDESNAGSGKGRYNNFQQGTIIWKSGSSEAFTVYGEIYNKWRDTGFDLGYLGFPISDEQGTISNTGRFNDFENGAVYYQSGKVAHVVKSPILEAWTLLQREQGKMKFPLTDTSIAADNPASPSQTFQGGKITCTKVSSMSIVSRPTLSCSIKAVSRDALNKDKANTNDTRTYPLMELNRHVRLRTALVTFKGSYTRTLTDQDIADLETSYESAIENINRFTFGLARVKHTNVVINSVLAKADFADYKGDSDPKTFQAEFRAYQKVINAFQANNLKLTDFDVVSINIPWISSASDVPSGFAWANDNLKLGNQKTYSTIHHIFPGQYWWAFYVHETFHCLEWMLEVNGYKALRNPDEAWWLNTYSELKSSTIIPQPVNLGKSGEYLLYAMYARIKENWFNLPPSWGNIVNNAAEDNQHSTMLMYSAPDNQTLVEQAIKINYANKLSPICQKIANLIKGLENEKQSLAEELKKASPAQKPFFSSQIKALNGEITKKKWELEDCIKKNSFVPG